MYLIKDQMQRSPHHKINVTTNTSHSGEVSSQLREIIITS